MFYCVTQPLSHYDVTLEGIVVGLNMTYGHHPPLFNLILLTTLAPFGYEKGTELNPAKVIVELSNGELFVETLKTEVKGKKITELVSKLTPLEFARLIMGTDVSHLPVCDMFSAGQEAFKMITASRAVTWALNFRGPIGQKGNVTTAAFGANSIQVPSDMRQHHTGMINALTQSRDRNQ